MGDIQISLPKVEMKMHYDLKNIFTKMGITDPLTKEQSLKQWVRLPENFLTRAIHDVFMKVDEKRNGRCSSNNYRWAQHPCRQAYTLTPLYDGGKRSSYRNISFMGKIEDPTK